MDKEKLNNHFMYACAEGNLKSVRYLLTSPELTEHADIHAGDDYGFREACAFNHLEVIRYLLTSQELTEHADIHAAWNSGFRWACINDNRDVIEFFIASPELKEHNTFEDYKPLDCWFKNYSSKTMHGWISLMSQERIDNLYEKHFDFLLEKFTLEAGLPLHTTSHQQQNDEIEIMI